MNQQPRFAIVALIGIMFSSLCHGQTTSTAESESVSGIEGVISVSPIHGGPSRVGVPDSKPFANGAFVVQNEQGVISSFTTDAEGRFKVLVAPGHYAVAMKEAKPRIGRYGPFEVDVSPGKITKVQWTCDTGMR